MHKYKPPKQDRRSGEYRENSESVEEWGETWTVVKYLWKGASQPSCKELGFIRCRDHPCLNMSAWLPKLLRLVSEMLPRSCTALTWCETPPTPLPHPSCSVPPTNTVSAGSLLFYLLPRSGFIYITHYSYPDGGYSLALSQTALVAGGGEHWRDGDNTGVGGSGTIKRGSLSLWIL